MVGLGGLGFCLVWFQLAGTVADDIELTEFFLNRYKSAQGETGVALVPGSAFAMPATALLVRINCARDSLRELEDAVASIDRALGALLARA